MRINNWAVIIVIFIVGIIQTTAMCYISVWGAIPDLLLISVTFFALYFGFQTGFCAAFTAGLIRDITSTSVFGSSIFTFFVLALLLSRYSAFFYKHQALTQMLLCACLCAAVTYIVLFINSIAYKNMEINLLSYVWITLKTSIYTGIIAPLVFFTYCIFFRVRMIYC